MEPTLSPASSAFEPDAHSFRPARSQTPFHLGLRALAGLSALGSRLLARRPFDVVFFSTTVFPAMALGPIWKRRFRIPYALDFQDPWGNTVEVVQYDQVQFTKSDRILSGMGLDLGKTPEALAELQEKRLA